MFSGLDRDDLISGLRAVVERAHQRGLGPISIRIIGGAAIRLAYFERATTVDIDARIDPNGSLSELIDEIAAERQWPNDWLNSAAQKAGFIPTWGRQVEWMPLYTDDLLSIEVASVEALLAMKLRAFERRGRRDLGDVVGLLALSGASDAAEVEELFEAYFPGDTLQQTTVDFLRATLADGLTAAPTPPPIVFRST